MDTTEVQGVNRTQRLRPQRSRSDGARRTYIPDWQAHYVLDTRLSEAPLALLQMLEVTFRNHIHAVLVDTMHERSFDADDFLLVGREPEAPNWQHVRGASGQRQGSHDRARRRGTHLQFLDINAFAGLRGDLAANLHPAALRNDGKGRSRKGISSPATPLFCISSFMIQEDGIAQGAKMPVGISDLDGQKGVQGEFGLIKLEFRVSFQASLVS